MRSVSVKEAAPVTTANVRRNRWMLVDAAVVTKVASPRGLAAVAEGTDDYARGSVMNPLLKFRRMLRGHRLHPIRMMRVTIRLGILLTTLARRSQRHYN